MTEATRPDAEVRAFRRDIPQEDLHDRLGRTRWPGAILGAGWDRAVPLDLLVGGIRGPR